MIGGAVCVLSVGVWCRTMYPHFSATKFSRSRELNRVLRVACGLASLTGQVRVVKVSGSSDVAVEVNSHWVALSARKQLLDRIVQTVIRVEVRLTEANCALSGVNVKRLFGGAQGRTAAVHQRTCVCVCGSHSVGWPYFREWPGSGP